MRATPIFLLILFFIGTNANANEFLTLPIALMPVTCVQYLDHEDCSGPIEDDSTVTIELDKYIEGRAAKVWSGQHTLTASSAVGIFVAEIMVQKRYYEVFKATSYEVKIELYNKKSRAQTRVLIELETSHPSVNSNLTQLNGGKFSGIRETLGDRQYYPRLIFRPAN
jgi:hypothetical protein